MNFERLELFGVSRMPGSLGALVVVALVALGGVILGALGALERSVVGVERRSWQHLVYLDLSV